MVGTCIAMSCVQDTLMIDYAWHEPMLSKTAFAFFSLAGMMLNSLNIFWFLRMVTSVLNRFKGNSINSEDMGQISRTNNKSRNKDK